MTFLYIVVILSQSQGGSCLKAICIYAAKTFRCTKWASGAVQSWYDSPDLEIKKEIPLPSQEKQGGETWLICSHNQTHKAKQRESNCHLLPDLEFHFLSIHFDGFYFKVDACEAARGRKEGTGKKGRGEKKNADNELNTSHKNPPSPKPAHLHCSIYRSLSQGWGLIPAASPLKFSTPQCTHIHRREDMEKACNTVFCFVFCFFYHIFHFGGQARRQIDSRGGRWEGPCWKLNKTVHATGLATLLGKHRDGKRDRNEGGWTFWGQIEEWDVREKVGGDGLGKRHNQCEEEEKNRRSRRSDKKMR